MKAISKLRNFDFAKIHAHVVVGFVMEFYLDHPCQEKIFAKQKIVTGTKIVRSNSAPT
jgi:hypothetical protein